jgi:uncharacterized membrane-anchored protein YitT (DUF2179 family)/predicted metal-dependent HD superfamily phosphohydrolase
MQIQAAKAFILRKLEKELPEHLTYHNVQHTSAVFNHAKELAVGENITGDELDLLLTAALFHDSGFLVTYQNHEEASCNIAREELVAFDYTPEQIEFVCSLIMATKMPQQPQTILQQVLCDADLYYLGTSSYIAISEKLIHELHKTGTHKTRVDWMNEQKAFMAAHQYFTETAQKKLTAKQKANLAALENMKPVIKELKHDGFSTGDILLILVGVITAAFALKGFLVPNNFFDGGVTGISLLIHEIYGFNLAFVILIANLPLIVMSRFAISTHFALKTLFCIVMLGVCLHYIPYPVITSDKLLVSIFGGFFLGIGIGLTMRAGCAVDGIEVLALYTWRKTSFTISEIILALNIIIFSIAAFKFGIPTSLYSMLTYFTASKTVDYVVEGIEAYTGVTIISGKSEVIKDRLVNELGRGITIYKGERGFLPGKFEVHEDCDIIFTVITRLELRKLKNLVSEVDERAFVFASTIRETSGGIIKRRHMH